MLRLDYSMFIGAFIAVTGALLAEIKVHYSIIFLLCSLSALFFVKRQFEFLLLVFAGIILLYPIETHPFCFFLRFHIHPVDVIFIGYITLYFIYYRHESPWRIKVPFHPALLAFLIFFMYNFIMMFRFTTASGLNWGIFEIRKYFYTFAVILSLLKAFSRYRKMVLMLFFIILVTDIGGILNSLGFLYRFLLAGQSQLSARQLVQISFYFSQSFLICLIGLFYFRQRKIRRFLIISAVVTGLSMIFDQTRGFWISTAVSICIFFLIFIPFRQVLNLKNIRYVFLVFFIMIAINIALQIKTIDFVKSRLKNMKSAELIDPLSSIGYRIYESSVVLSHTSFTGHGLKAPLYLYLPWEERKSDWYGIHSQYMEILHCTGIFGLMFFLIFSFLYLYYSLKLAKNRNKNRAFFGRLIFITYINTLIVSITSGFFIRFSSCLFLGYMLTVLLVFDNRFVSREKDRPNKSNFEPIPKSVS